MFTTFYVCFECKNNLIFAFLGTEPACNPARDMPANRVCFCLWDKLLEFFWENDNLSEDRVVSFFPNSSFTVDGFLTEKTLSDYQFTQEL